MQRSSQTYLSLVCCPRNPKALSRSAWIPCLLLLWGQTLLAGETLKSLAGELHRLVDSSKVSVVTVAARVSREVYVEKESGILSFFKSEREKHAISYVNVGSGLIIDHLGHVVTRRSIVARSEYSTITLHDGTKLPAEFVAEDPETGFAILKIEAENLKPAQFGDIASVRPGSWVVMIGNSLGAFPSVDFGAVNGLRSDGLIQISANLNPGNNGSPIFDLEGRVIGVVAGRITATHDMSGSVQDVVYSEATLVYPINWVERITEDLIELGRVRKGWLGVVGYYDGWKPKIKAIKRNSPAERAGLVEGDVIINFANREVNSISELMRLVEFARPGEHVPLRFRRGGQVFETEVEIGEKRRNHGVAGAVTPPPVKLIHAGDEETAAPLLQDWPLELWERNEQLERRISALEKELYELRKKLKSP